MNYRFHCRTAAIFLATLLHSLPVTAEDRTTEGLIDELLRSYDDEIDEARQSQNDDRVKKLEEIQAQDIENFRHRCAKGVLDDFDINPTPGVEEFLKPEEVGALCQAALITDVAADNTYSSQARDIPTSRAGDVTANQLALMIRDSAALGKLAYLFDDLPEDERVFVSPPQAYDAAYATARDLGRFDETLAEQTTALSDPAVPAEQKAHLRATLKLNADKLAVMCFTNVIPNDNLYYCSLGGQMLALSELSP